MSSKEIGDKIISKYLVIAIVGIKQYGLLLALKMIREGYYVIGIDTDKQHIKKLKHLDISETNKQEILEVLNSKRFMLTSDYSKIRQADIIILDPEPEGEIKGLDRRYLEVAVINIKKHIHKNQLIVLESTTYPGTTEELIQKPVEALGYKIGEDFFVCYSPQSLDVQNKIDQSPKIIAGVTEECAELAADFYQLFFDKVTVIKSLKSSEMIKLIENAFRGLRIVLPNELIMKENK